MDDLALILHTAELADDLPGGDLATLVQQEAQACSPELTCALLVEGRRMVVALEGPKPVVQAAARQLSRRPWLTAGQALADQALPERLFPGWRPRLVQVHPSFRQAVDEAVAQLLARPDAANVQTMLRLLQGLAPST